jgi:LysR family glycine cleavage system transcriptional activator
VDASRGTHFSLPDHGLQAAINGAGIVLGWRSLSAKDVAAGRVVEPFDVTLPLGSSFYLVYPEAHSLRPQIAAFRDWLKNELREGQKSERNQ